MNAFFNFVLVVGATFGFCYGIYLLILELATRYPPYEEESREDPNDFC